MNRGKYILLCIISLFIGGLYYIFFKSNTVLENILSKHIDVIPMNADLPIISSQFFKCYFCDFLWAFSLQCGLCALLLPTKKGLFQLCLIVTVIGINWEILQYANIINGTGDFTDIIIYFLGSGSTSLIKNKSKGDLI